MAHDTLFVVFMLFSPVAAGTEFRTDLRDIFLRVQLPCQCPLQEKSRTCTDGGTPVHRFSASRHTPIASIMLYSMFFNDTSSSVNKPAALLMTTYACLALGGIADSETKVQIDAGWVRGVTAQAVVSFKGIPYAAPPVGARRWRAPAPPASWANVRDGSAFGPGCPQMSSDTETARTSEDCLTINVWRPRRVSSQALPVMVWIYGGAFMAGASSLPMYDGTQLAAHSLIVVSFNYRVGRLGFFAHPALTRSAGPDEMLANYGFMDQIAALQWVKRNIAAFGGDPANVTIFGQSAGGASVDMLMLAPPARGLFAKAISESGFPRWGGKAMRGVADSAENDGVEFGMRNGISGDTFDAADRLRALPVDRVMLSTPIDEDRTWPAPIVDGKILPKNAAVLLAEGQVAAVPLLIGGTSCDASIYGDRYLSPFKFAEPNGQPFESLYAGTPRDAAVQALTDRIETEPVRFQARTHAATGQPVWVYYYDYRHSDEPRRSGDCAGTPHAAEIRYVFGTLSADSPFDLRRFTVNAEDRRLSRQLQEYWTAFAKHGDPNGTGRPRWPAFNQADELMMVFAPPGPVVRSHYRAAQLDWIGSKLTTPWVW
jgi:para-nitrobenzyl esterase